MIVGVALWSLLAVAYGASVPVNNRYPTPTQHPTTYDANSYGPTLEQVQALVRTLEDDLKDTQTGLAAATTQCAVGWERLKFIRDKRLPALKLKDAQHAALIDVFKAEIKAMQHRADAAQASVDSSIQRANDTAAEVARLSALLTSVNAGNVAQNVQITSLTSSLLEFKAQFLDSLQSNIDFLQSNLTLVKNKISLVHEFVESRKCEYGFFAINLDKDHEYRRINFSSAFDETPTVATSIVGFSAHLDVHTYQHEYDVLGIDKFVDTTVDAAGFVAHAVDASSGKVDLKTVYCSYMACQNLEDKFILPPHPVAVP